MVFWSKNAPFVLKLYEKYPEKLIDDFGVLKNTPHSEVILYNFRLLPIGLRVYVSIKF